MNRGGGERRIARVDIGPPERSVAHALDAEVVRGADGLREVEKVRRRLGREEAAIEQRADLRAREPSASIEVGNELLDHFHRGGPFSSLRRLDRKSTRRTPVT